MKVPASLLQEMGLAKTSLRNIAPSNWRRDGVSPDGFLDGKTLYIRSSIAGYCINPIENKVGAEVAQFIKENGRSARRLRVLSISAYESFASLLIIPPYVQIGAMTLVALTTGVAMLDALACVLWGLLFCSDARKEPLPKDANLPDMKKLRQELKKRHHTFYTPISELLDSE